MVLRFWTGQINNSQWGHVVYEHCCALVVSANKTESPHINRGRCIIGYDVAVVTHHGLVTAFLEDDDEKYLWSVIA